PATPPPTGSRSSWRRVLARRISDSTTTVVCPSCRRCPTPCPAAPWAGTPQPPPTTSTLTTSRGASRSSRRRL
ncbi:hypothetical protein CRUP_012005, partial [Coryphaenoides rupestris]